MSIALFTVKQNFMGARAGVIFVSSYRWSCWRGQVLDTTCDPGAVAVGPGLNLEAEQVLRIVSVVFYAEAAWFVPWLIGFALLGAAPTGVCPCILGAQTVRLDKCRQRECQRSRTGGV